MIFAQKKLILSVFGTLFFVAVMAASQEKLDSISKFVLPKDFTTLSFVELAVQAKQRKNAAVNAMTEEARRQNLTRYQEQQKELQREKELQQHGDEPIGKLLRKCILKPYDQVMVAQYIGTKIDLKASISQKRLQKIHDWYIHEKTEFDGYTSSNRCKKTSRLESSTKYDVVKESDDVSDNEVANIFASEPTKHIDFQLNKGRETPAPLITSSKKLLKLSPSSVRDLWPAIKESTN
jgi:hypothetical protein